MQHTREKVNVFFSQHLKISTWAEFIKCKHFKKNKHKYVSKSCAINNNIFSSWFGFNLLQTLTNDYAGMKVEVMSPLNPLKPSPSKKCHLLNRHL